MGVQFTSVRGQNDRVGISANELMKKGDHPPPNPVLYKNRMRYRIIVVFVWSHGFRENLRLFI